MNKETLAYTKAFHFANNAECAIFDFDSTLAESHAEGDWNDVAGLQPIQPMIELAQMLIEHGFDIVIATARPDRQRAAVEQWLAQHLPAVAAVYLKATVTDVTAAIAKEDMLKDIEKTWDVALAVDDSPFNTRMFRDHGITCLRPTCNDEYWDQVGDA